jgi:hypothetical protein
LKRGINEFMKGYQPRTMGEKGDMVTDSHSGLATCRNHFSHVLNVHGINDVRQTELQQSLVPEPSAFEVEMAIKQLKADKSPGVDQIPA